MMNIIFIVISVINVNIVSVYMIISAIIIVDIKCILEIETCQITIIIIF